VFQSNRTLDFEIYTMAVDGSDVRNVSKNGADDRFPTWSADGKQIFWTRYSDSFNIWQMNADGSDQRVVLAGSFSDTSPAAAPDGSAVVFASNRVAPSSLFTYTRANGVVRQLTNLPGWTTATDLDPVWAP
jgi:Tol biopolymer transport system component